MKRILILVAIIALVAGSVFADEAVVIDFSKLAADIHVKKSADDEDTTPNQNRQTMMDYSGVQYGSTFTADQKATMKTSLAIAEWNVKLNSSAKTVTNMENSLIKEADSKLYGKVLGVRIHFPVERFNTWAEITPPFEIPAYEPPADVQDDGTIEPGEGDGITTPSRFEDGYGVVKNVGIIKNIAVNVYGQKYPYKLEALFIDGNGNKKEVYMGVLNFDGWGELQWKNPAYTMEVRNRDLRIFPLYPDYVPFIKFGGFRVKRDADQLGGDFTVYFKDVKIIYDKAQLDTDRDIQDEALWKIISDRETARKLWEIERFGQNQVLRYLETQKQAQEPYDPITGKSTFTESQTSENTN